MSILAAPSPLTTTRPSIRVIHRSSAGELNLDWPADRIAEAVADLLRAKHPRAVIAGCHAGVAGPEGDEESLRLIAAARPDIVLVAYGAPRQEFWVDRNLDRLDAGVGIGVGGSFDYLSGRVPRAPAWMRRVGVEWLYRLARQPWRARRMAVLPLFAFEVLRSRA